ncbi:MAG: VCBS repeat-containing protein [Caldilinea sp. CFX5]|nr:VCBS repeat-containing protein [Caldilinea sp. CFX5]
MFRPSTGEWWLAQSRDGQKVVNFGQAGDIPIQADHDGDKRTDIAIWRPSNGTAYWPNGGAYPWGQAGDIPVYADYDGDGKADSAIFRPSTNDWLISQTRDGHKVVRWGEAGDIPVARDYDGDGKADIAIWRPRDGVWWIIKSSNGAHQSTLPWGQAGDTPVPADFDGDGKVDPAVVRNENGVLFWYIWCSSDGQKQRIDFGEAGDVLVP